MKEYIAEASSMARKMIKWETVSAGDTPQAMRNLANRHHLPYQLFWTLKYRPPKQIAYDLVVAFRKAYRDECRRLAKELSEGATDGLAGVNDGLDAALLLAARDSARRMEEKYQATETE